MAEFITRKLPMMLAGVFLSASLLLADSLSLKSGEVIQGTFLSGNQNDISFRVNGVARQYSVRDVKGIEFAALPVSTAARRWRIVDNSWVHLAYPANWQMTEQGERVVLSSAGSNRFRGNREPGANVMVGMHREWGLAGVREGSLEEETNKILAGLGGEFRGFRETGGRQEIRIDGQRAFRTDFTSMSARGIRDHNRLVTVGHPEGVLYIVFSAAASDFPSVEQTFQQMQSTLQLAR